MSNLFHTLYDTSEDNHSNFEDVTMETINQLHGHLHFDTLSRYYDLTTYNNLLVSQESSQLSIIHMNSRSLPKNSDNIKSFLKCLHCMPDIITFTETWLTSTNTHLHEFSRYHSYHLTRTTRAHGEVSIFVSDSLNSDQENDLTFINDKIEINTIKISTNTMNFLLCVICRPNTKHVAVDEFVDVLNTLF